MLSSVTPSDPILCTMSNDPGIEPVERAFTLLSVHVTPSTIAHSKTQLLGSFLINLDIDFNLPSLYYIKFVEIFSFCIV